MSAITKADRLKFIGSSEVAALLGASRFLTPFELWHQKAGDLAPADLDNVERVQAGRFLEPGIAAWAADKWGWQIDKADGYDLHPTVKGMGASCDWQETGTRRPVEIKNVDYLIFRDHWEADGDVILDAPVDYLVQVQHQLACRPEVDHGWLVVCVSGNRLFRMKVPRHAAIIAEIESRVAAFWTSIEAGEAPTPDFEKDAANLARLYTVINDGPPLDFTGHNRLNELCAEYKAAGEVEKEAKGRKDAASAEILSIIGPAKKVETAGFNISAWTVAEADVAYTRRAFRSSRITPKKDKAA